MNKFLLGGFFFYYEKILVCENGIKYSTLEKTSFTIQKVSS